MSEHTPLFWGRVKNFKPEIHELKVFEGKYEIHDEAQKLNEAIMNANSAEFWDNPLLTPLKMLFDAHTIPLAPFPSVEGCLGLGPKDSHLTIKEGMAVMSIDYKVSKSSKNCLFNMNQNKLMREARRLEKYEKSPLSFAEK